MEQAGVSGLLRVGCVWWVCSSAEILIRCPIIIEDAGGWLHFVVSILLGGPDNPERDDALLAEVGPQAVEDRVGVVAGDAGYSVCVLDFHGILFCWLVARANPLHGLSKHHFLISCKHFFKLFFTLPADPLFYRVPRKKLFLAKRKTTPAPWLVLGPRDNGPAPFGRSYPSRKQRRECPSKPHTDTIRTSAGARW
jgi:hypothetical protein